ncbi:MAG: D-alanyl-D-alanine carboxypeptidase [Lachnospiraceae bacterium]|nr:D-alanyl-D-alanine carboxypeptidase [Lachnospiraceae bacterium]
MEPYYEEDELERQARRSRRLEQMLREKRKQEKRRRFIKKYWPFLMGGVAVLAIVLVVGIAGSKKDDIEDGKLLAGIGETLEQSSDREAVGSKGDNLPHGEQEGNGATNGTSTGSNELSQGQDVASEMSTAEPSVTEAPTTEQDKHQNNGNTGNGTNSGTNSAVTVPYQFETTSDTVNITSEKVISTNVILINESTDTIIASKGAKERISPASMTKVLTVLVAAEHIAMEELEEPFQITLEYTDYAFVNDCSTAGFAKDEMVKVKDLFYGTILPSGGEAAVALATYVAGSHEAFVELMNEKLEELGLSESAHFTNCVGLYDEEHYCTVYDMAVIMKAALQNEWCREVLAAHTYTTTSTSQHPDGILISNWFLRRIEDKDTGGEVLCAKTGYVRQSGSCAVSYGVFADETPYICVTRGSDSTWNCIYDHVEIYNSYVPKE